MKTGTRLLYLQKNDANSIADGGTEYIWIEVEFIDYILSSIIDNSELGTSIQVTVMLVRDVELNTLTTLDPMGNQIKFK